MEGQEGGKRPPVSLGAGEGVMVQTLSHLPEEGTLTEAADTQQQSTHNSCPTFHLQVLHHKGFPEGEVIQKAGQAAGKEEF